MRFDATPAQVKMTAKQLSQVMPRLSASRLESLLCKGLGWRSWHEMSNRPKGPIYEGERLGTFPLAARDSLTGALPTMHMFEEGVALFSQISEVFCEELEESCPALTDPSILLEMLAETMIVGVQSEIMETLYMHDGVKTESPFYPLSLTVAFSLAWPDYWWMDEEGLFQCEHGHTVVAADEERIDCLLDDIFDWGPQMSDAAEKRFERSLERFDHDQLVVPGKVRDSIALALLDVESEAIGAAFVTWCVDCPADSQSMNAMVRIDGLVMRDLDYVDHYSRAIALAVLDPLRTALLAMAGAPECELTLCVQVEDTYPGMVELGDEVCRILAGDLSVINAIMSDRMRLEFCKRPSGGKKVVRVHSLPPEQGQEDETKQAPSKPSSSKVVKMASRRRKSTPELNETE